MIRNRLSGIHYEDVIGNRENKENIRFPEHDR